MVTNQTAPASPGFIDRLRAWIAKVFGAPAGAPNSPEPVPARGAATPAHGQSADKTMRMIAPHRESPAT